MATVTRLQKIGDQILVRFSDGSSILTVNTGTNIFYPKDTSSPISFLQFYNNQLYIIFIDNTMGPATAVSDNLWYSNATYTPPPPPPPVNVWEWPMDTSRWMISSPFGPRTTPYTGFHYGIDITGHGVTGVPVWAIGAGTVITNAYNSRAGYWVEIAHPDGTWTQYMHFPTYGPIPVGTDVVAGTQIGNVGTTGDATGAHLHFQTQDTSNTAMDPIIYMRDRGHEFGEVQPT